MKQRHQRRFRKRAVVETARSRHARFLCFEPLERREMLAADLALTEFMASNSATLLDRHGESSDWIEIHNAGSAQADLTGWALTDDPADPAKWRLPGRILEPDQYLVVFASGRDERPASALLTRDFNATDAGTFVVDLPEGNYEVRVIMGDVVRPREQMLLYIQGALLDTVATAGGEFAIHTTAVDVSGATGGQLSLRLEDLGGETARAVINALVITPAGGGIPRRFDFGPADSPIEPGYTGVTMTDIYSTEMGYGWLSGAVIANRDRAGANDELHANFRLNAEHGYVALVSPSGRVVSEFGSGGNSYPPQTTDISYGTTPTGTRYFMHPTPGVTNGRGRTGFAVETHWSVDRGFYTNPFSLAITTVSPGATIRYTTDGSAPSADHGTVYSTPITVSGTTTLRAAAFRPDLVPSPVETRTYLFPDDIVRQSKDNLPPGFPPGAFAGQVLDYGMDPDILSDPEWGPQLTAALKAVPTFSLVTDARNLFDAQTGIYVNAGRHGKQWERPTSVELITADGSPGFQIDAGLRIRGGYSRQGRNPKHAFRLFFRSEYGDAPLQFPLFGAEGTDRFDNIDLRTTQNYSWAFGGDPRNTFLRDVFSRDVQREMQQPYTRSRYYHLYINGQYWGLFQSQERAEASYAASYFGGDKDDYDVVKSAGNTGGYRVEVTDGNLDAYHRLYQASRVGFADDSAYFRVQGMNPDGSRNPDHERLLDVDNLIDYMIVTYYTGDKDGPGTRFVPPQTNNFFGIFNRANPDGFRWFEHDSEHSLDAGAANMVSPLVTHFSTFNEAAEFYFNPHWLHEKLMENAEYRQCFDDRVQKYFGPGGVLAEANALKLIDQRAAEIETAMIAESARWGDAQRSESREPLNPDDWADAVETIRRWIPGRTEAVLSQLRAVAWFPETDAPTFSRPGGTVPRFTQVTLTAPAGTIYYTRDGSDPRLVGGGMNPGAIVYDPNSPPLILSHSERILARVRSGSEWSALSEAVFVVDTPVRISEIQYHPEDPTAAELVALPGLDDADFEFVEIVNTGEETTDLSDLELTDGIHFAFAGSDITRLGPGQYALVVRNRRAFEMRYGTGLPVAGEFARGTLANGGEQITLADHLGIAVQSFTYDDAGPWPLLADGYGPSLEVVDANDNDNDPENWRASTEYGGSPGAAGRDPTARIVINEVLSRSGDAEPDQIELYNRTDHAVDLSGWYLTDDAIRLGHARLAPGTILGAGAYLTLDAAGLGFGLSGTKGDALWLIETGANGHPVRLVDHVQFDATDVGVALGRWPNGVPESGLFPMKDLSFGAANPGPRSGAVVISEIHYHPPTTPSIVAEDFADGTARNVTPVQGTWVVRDGGYAVTPGSEGDTIATIATDEPLPTNFVFSTTLRIRTVPDFNQNGAILFDYRSPTDFKFVAGFARGDKWRIGRRDAAGWHFLADAKTPVEADTNMQVRMEVFGSRVVVRIADVRLHYDFGAPLRYGQVGLGSKDGTARFDDLRLARVGNSRDLEFLELLGASAVPIDLGGWRLEGTVDWDFASGTTLATGEVLVLVSFDPADAAQETFFRQTFGIEDSVVLIGPYQGRLRDVGRTVRLTKPVVPDDANTGGILVDQVDFDNHSPWPTAADGQGRSLDRVAVSAYGRDPANWSALKPTPGTLPPHQIGDLDSDRILDTDDVRLFVQILANPARYQTAYGAPATALADADQDGDVDVDDIDSFIALLHAGGVVAQTRDWVESDAHGESHTSASGLIGCGRSARGEQSRGRSVNDRLVAADGDRNVRRRSDQRTPGETVGIVARAIRDRERIHPRRPRIGGQAEEAQSWDVAADHVLKTESMWLDL